MSVSEYQAQGEQKFKLRCALETCSSSSGKSPRELQTSLKDQAPRQAPHQNPKPPKPPKTHPPPPQNPQKRRNPPQPPNPPPLPPDTQHPPEHLPPKKNQFQGCGLWGASRGILDLGRKWPKLTQIDPKPKTKLTQIDPIWRGILPPPKNPSLSAPPPPPPCLRAPLKLDKARGFWQENHGPFRAEGQHLNGILGGHGWDLAGDNWGLHCPHLKILVPPPLEEEPNPSHAAFNPPPKAQGFVANCRE